MPIVVSHAEADYIADNYRRRCRRVAVHREGQPPRERTAPVLPKSYRPPHDRDPETIRQLLADFVRSNDKATAIVLEDALLEDGYDWAAHDLRETIAMGCRTRRGLAERILSEVLNDSAVLEHGEWRFPSGLSNPGPNPYVMILERTPIHFRGGSRHTSRRRREPRIVIWSRYGNRPGLCRWVLFGTYNAREFSSMAEAEAVAREDIRNAKVPRGNRQMTTAWTYDGYWTAVLGMRNADEVRAEFGLDVSDRRGLDEWLSLAEVEAWRIGGEGGDLPEEWRVFHTRALADLAAE